MHYNLIIEIMYRSQAHVSQMFLYDTGHSKTNDPEAVTNMFTVVTQWRPMCERLIQIFLKFKIFF